MKARISTPWIVFTVFKAFIVFMACFSGHAHAQQTYPSPSGPAISLGVTEWAGEATDAEIAASKVREG